MPSRLARILASFLSLPAWVRLWLLLCLFPANAAAFLFAAGPVGHWASLAFVLVGLSNGAMVWYQAGLSRLLAVPHLVFWGPLQVYLVGHLIAAATGAAPFGPAEVYAAVLASINGISLMFDAWDSLRWLRGERAVFRPQP